MRRAVNRLTTEIPALQRQLNVRTPVREAERLDLKSVGRVAVFDPWVTPEGSKKAALAGRPFADEQELGFIQGFPLPRQPKEVCEWFGDARLNCGCKLGLEWVAAEVEPPEALQLAELGRQGGELVPAEVKVLQARQLAELGGQGSKLVAAEVKDAEARQLAKLGGRART